MGCAMVLEVNVSLHQKYIYAHDNSEIQDKPVHFTVKYGTILYFKTRLATPASVQLLSCQVLTVALYRRKTKGILSLQRVTVICGSSVAVYTRSSVSNQ